MASETTPLELATATRRYLVATLGEHPDIMETEPPAGVKLGVKNRYHYHSLVLYDKALLLCTPKENVEWTPKKIEDDFISFHEAGQVPVLLVKQIAAVTRTRLIERRINFIDPGKQLHLPGLLISLSDYGLKTTHKVHSLSPSAQHILLYLYQSENKPTGHTAWGELFDYSRITIHRALRELEAINAIKTSRKGKLLQVYLSKPGQDGFTNLLTLLKSPVNKILHLAEVPSVINTLGTHSAFTALSSTTDILDDPIPTLAISKSAYQANKSLLEECVSSDPARAVCQLEVWNYAPTLPIAIANNESYGKSIDKLSLYLSMKDGADERTEAALEQLIQTISWHKD